MSAQTIDEIIERLDEIVAQCRRERSSLGYFAALYRRVTVEVRDGIAQGRFEDGARMEQLDVRFANRYLDAWDRFQQGERPTESWQVAFEMGEQPLLIVLQHLFLGMNAHINLDLGIAAARSCPGPALFDLQHDFDEINELLGSLLDEVQERLGRVSPTMRLLDQTVTYSDKLLFGFLMGRARSEAWAFALRLARWPEPQQERLIRWQDRRVRSLAFQICTPDWQIGPLVRLIARAERKEVVKVIDCLS